MRKGTKVRGGAVVQRASHCDSDGDEKGVSSTFSFPDEEQHVQLLRSDLVAYEYVDATTHAWAWGLGTVAALPDPRRVQLLLWTCHDERRPTVTPARSSIADSMHAKTVQELKEVQARKAEAAIHLEDLNTTCAWKRAKCDAVRAEGEAELAAAQQTLLAACRMIREAPEKDWREIRTYNQAPAIVALVMEATMCVLGERAITWNDMLKVIRSGRFLSDVTRLDPSAISSVNLHRLTMFFKQPRFNYENAMKGSQALGALQQWVTAQAAAARALARLRDAGSGDAKELEAATARMADLNNLIQGYTETEHQLRNRLRGKAADAGLDTSAGTASADKLSPTSRSPKKSKGPITASSGESTGDAELEVDHRFQALWTLTEKSLLVLRTAILTRYDAPRAMTHVLAPQQVVQLKRVLQIRTASHPQNMRAGTQHTEVQTELAKALRGGHSADALRACSELKETPNDPGRRIAARDLREALEAAKAAPVGAFDLCTQQQVEKWRDRGNVVDYQRGGFKSAVRSSEQGQPLAEESISFGAVCAGGDTRIVDTLGRDIMALQMGSAKAREVLASISKAIEADARLKASAATGD